MHTCSPHTRLSVLLGCLEWKHSQGWQRKSGKHFFLCKQKNTSLVCCYCTILGHCFICWNNSRTFKWTTKPETRAHHWRWGEKAYRPLCGCVCKCVCFYVSLLCVRVCSHWHAHHHWPPKLQDQGAGWGVYMRRTVWLYSCAHEGVCVPTHGFQSFLFLKLYSYLECVYM